MKIVIDIPEEAYNAGQLVHYFGCYSDKLDKVIYDGTPLPKGHGDLIDRTELLDSSYEIDSMYGDYDKVVHIDDIKNAPTIIGAESEDKHENSN